MAKLSNISFWEFYNFLLEVIKEEFPETELFIIKGGDYVQDVVMEFRQNDHRVRYTPYELYQEGYLHNNFEEIVEHFIETYKNRMKTEGVSNDKKNNLR